MTLRRDLLLRSGLFAAAGLIATPSPADTAWNPEGAVRIVVPVAPGSSLDILGRRLARALDRILAQPDVADQRTAQGFEVTSQGPAQFASLIQTEARRWPALVRRSGAQPD